MALVKTVGVLILIGLVLWILFTVIGWIAATVWFFIEFLVVAAVIGAIYHHFKHQKAH